MKKIVLVNIPSSENAYHSFQHFVAVFPPIGLTSIAAVLENAGYDVSILDADAMGLSLDEAVDVTVQAKPDYVGSTVMTATMDITGKFFSSLKEKMPSVVTLTGGPHISAVPRQTLEEFSCIDIAVSGEGEETLIELMPALDKNQSLDGIEGIAYRHEGKVRENPLRPPIKDLSSLPLPAYHLLDFKLYRSYAWNNWVSGYRAPMGVVFTGRGCIGKCNFCGSHCVFGKGIRFFDIERIKQEIDLLVDRYNIRILYFQDDTFTANRKIVNQICDFLIERGYNKSIETMVSSRVDTVHLPTLKKMRSAGIRWICYGVESGNETILKRMRKNITIDQIVRAFDLAKEADLYTAGNFMIGHIDETWETAMDTINLCCRLKQDYTSFAIAIPFPGTELYDYCIENNIKLPTWNDFGSVNSPPIPLNENLGCDALLKLRMIAINRFFKRPMYILGMLTRFKTFAVLSDFTRMYLSILSERRKNRF